MPSGHPQHRGCDSFDCCTERYEIVVLLPNSELTKGNKKCDADAHTVRLRRKTMADGLFKLPITLLFVVLVLIFLVRMRGSRIAYSVKSAVAQW